MATPSLSEIVTTTLRDRSKVLSDNVTNNNALLARINSKGNRKPASGRDIIQELEYAENGTVSMYSNYDVIDTTPQDVLTSAVFDWKQLAGTVTISGLEEVQNSGSERVIDLLESRINVLEKSMANTLAAQLYSAGAASTDLDGLQKAVADDPTTGTYGGINRANFSFWRNQSYDFSALGITASSTTIQTAMNTLYLNCVRNADATDMIVAGNTYYTYYWESLQNIQRITSDGQGAAGFTSLKYLNSDVFFDANCAATRMYFLNTDYMKLRYHPDRDFVPLETRNGFNQDASVIPVAWAGNLVSSNASLQGVICA
jgi:hypothetical protein